VSFAVKVKHSLYRPWGFQEVEATRFQDSRHMQVVRLSALRTGRPYPQEIFPVLIFVRRRVDPKSYSAAGRIISTKNSNDTIGNRTRDVPACSPVIQPLGHWVLHIVGLWGILKQMTGTALPIVFTLGVPEHECRRARCR
jgi:hypothetical protein